MLGGICGRFFEGVLIGVFNFSIPSERIRLVARVSDYLLQRLRT